MSRTSTNKKYGFTLIEVIVVGAVLVLITSSLLFIINNKSLGNLSSDAEIIVARLKEAQGRAIAGIEASGWGIFFDYTGATPSYALFKGTTYGSAVNTYYLSNVVEFSAPASGASTTIAFAKLTGRIATTSTITVRLTNDNANAKTITVTPEGKISLQ